VGCVDCGRQHTRADTDHFDRGRNQRAHFALRRVGGGGARTIRACEPALAEPARLWAAVVAVWRLCGRTDVGAGSRGGRRLGILPATVAVVRGLRGPRGRRDCVGRAGPASHRSADVGRRQHGLARARLFARGRRHGASPLRTRAACGRRSARGNTAAAPQACERLGGGPFPGRAVVGSARTSPHSRRRSRPRGSRAAAGSRSGGELAARGLRPVRIARPAADGRRRIDRLARQRRVVHRDPLSDGEAPPDLHLDHHRDLRRRDRGGGVVDHHRLVGDERLRADLARGDHRQSRALHGAQSARAVCRLRRGARDRRVSARSDIGLAVHRRRRHGARPRGRDHGRASAGHRSVAGRQRDGPERRHHRGFRRGLASERDRRRRAARDSRRQSTRAHRRSRAR